MQNMGKMMKQLQKMQSRMADLQEELGDMTVEAASGGGAVKAVANGRKKLLSLTIDPAVLSEENREMAEDLILAAVNEVLSRADEMVAGEMQKITGGMKLPPGMF